MYAAIRDAMLLAAYPSLEAGLRDLELDAIELALSADFTLPKLDRAESLPAEGYAAHLQDHGVRCAALLTARDLGDGNLNDHAEWLARAVEIAADLGAGAVRVDSLMARESQLSYGDRVARMVDVLRAVLHATVPRSIPLAIENHGPLGNDPIFLLDVLHQVNHPRAGVTLDTGNFYWRGFPLAKVRGIIRLLAPYARHTHLKNVAYPETCREADRDVGWEYLAHACALEDGDIDLPAAIGEMRRAGYDGCLCIENEALWKEQDDGGRVALLRRDAAYIRRLLSVP